MIETKMHDDNLLDKVKQLEEQNLQLQFQHSKDLHEYQKILHEEQDISKKIMTDQNTDIKILQVERENLYTDIDLYDNQIADLSNQINALTLEVKHKNDIIDKLEHEFRALQEQTVEQAYIKEFQSFQSEQEQAMSVNFDALENEYRQ